jgi:hypothetical protein
VKRVFGIAAGLFIALFLFVQAVLAADPMAHTGRVLVSTGGDITLPAGEHADVVVVVNGTATIQGEVNTIVVVDGAANLLGARTETVFAVRSPIEVGPGTVVLGDVMRFDSAVHQTGDARIEGQVTDMAASAVQIGAVLAPALFLLWIGFGLATIAAGLLLAGIASRQVREAEQRISHDPVLTLAAGIVGVIGIPIVAILMMATLIGAPLGLGILLGLWPLIAFIGYLVAAIWIGESVLRRTGPERVRERPYLAAVIGVLILEVVTFIPVLTLLVALAAVFGFGAVLLQVFRAIRTPLMPRSTFVGQMPAPQAG